ncbi:MAG: TlpA disulfide reductase family protein [Actinomycetota bacterium]
MTEETPRVRHPIRWVAGGLALLTCIFAVIAATRPNFEASVEASPLVGKTAPAFVTSTLDGKPLSLSEHRNRTVILNFFASWCGPCQKEAPDLVAFEYQAKNAGLSVDLISVVFNNSNAAALHFVQTVGLTWPVAADPGGRIAASYGVTSPPTTVVIDSTGKVAEVLLGPSTPSQLLSIAAQVEVASR